MKCFVDQCHTLLILFIGSKVSGDRYSVESMMTFYFSMADHNDLDIALYGHIFSYFDNVSKEVSLL